MEASTIGATLRMMFTVEEAARQLSVGKSPVHLMLRGGGLSSVTVGRLRRVPVESLEALLASLPQAPSGADVPE